MPAIDERVAFIEGRVTEFSSGIEGLRLQIAAVDSRLIAFEQRMDQRFAATDQRLGAIDQRFAGHDQRFAALDDKLSRQFYWIIGVQMTTFVVIIGTILAAVFGR